MINSWRNMKCIFYMLILLFHTFDAHEKHWNWSKINVHTLSFPADFLWGCADSAFQTEGVKTAGGASIENSWTDYERSHTIAFEKRVGNGCERWDRYKEDITLLKSLGMTAYRFSIEWSKIEPNEGKFDHAAMQHYINVVDELRSCGITPFITVFHHTCPVWFMRKGGFEHKKNSKYFLEYALYVFAHLNTKVSFWIPFNEPVGFALEAYFRGRYPPCKKNLRLAGTVSKNILYTHTLVAKKFRELNPYVHIGCAHIIHLLDPYSSWNPIEHVIARFFDKVVNRSLLKFFTKGTFTWPYGVSYYNKNAPKTIDFIGINYGSCPANFRKI